MSFFLRFPATILFCLLSTAYWVSIVHEWLRNPSFLWFSTLFTGIFLFTAIALWTEKKSRNSIVWAHTAGFLFLILYFFYLMEKPEITQFTYFLVFFIIAGVGILLYPYQLAKSNPQSFPFTATTGPLFLIRLLRNFFLAVISGGILFIGLAIAIYVLYALFSEPYTTPGEFIATVWLILAGLYSPLYFLSLFPRATDFPLKQEEISKWEKILFLYVLAPLAFLYFTILTVYFILIALQWTLPQGMVANLVLSFSLIGLVVRFLIQPLQEQHRFYKEFYKIIYFWILPLLGLLALSISIRINAYGVTEVRYAVVLGAIWLAVVSLHGIWQKNDYQFTFVSLAVISLIAIAGPMGAVSIATKSQAKQLLNILHENGLIAEDGSLQHRGQLTTTAEREIQNKFKYLLERNRIDLLSDWLTPDEGTDLATYLGNFFAAESVIIEERRIYLRFDSTRQNGFSVAGYDWYRPNIYYWADGNSRFDLGDANLVMQIERNGEVEILQRRSPGSEQTVTSFNLFDALQPGIDLTSDGTIDPQYYLQEHHGENINIKLRINHLEALLPASEEEQDEFLLNSLHFGVLTTRPR